MPGASEPRLTALNPSRACRLGYSNRLRGLSNRSIVVVCNYEIWPDNGGTMPSKSTPFTPSSILFRPRRNPVRRRAWVEPPGTAPGSERLITTAVYRHSRLAPAPRNIGGKGYRRKSGPRVSRETNPIWPSLALRLGVLPARGAEYLAGGAGIERGDAQPDDQIRPSRGANAVTTPAATIAILASASLRAERNAALLRLPPWWR